MTDPIQALKSQRVGGRVQVGKASIRIQESTRLGLTGPTRRMYVIEREGHKREVRTTAERAVQVAEGRGGQNTA